MKGQSRTRGSIGKKFDVKGNSFKPLRGLDFDVVQQLLEEVAANEKSMAELAKDCSKIKKMGEVQKCLLSETGLTTWEEAVEKVPKFASAEALDEFAGTGFSSKALTPRYVITYNQLLSDTKMHIIVICYPETCVCACAKIYKYS